MTPRALSARLAKLEAERTSGWHAWRDVPVQQWPDAALYSHLGLSADCTDAELGAGQSGHVLQSPAGHADTEGPTAMSGTMPGSFTSTHSPA
jgi:hypothetical protein